VTWQVGIDDGTTCIPWVCLLVWSVKQSGPIGMWEQRQQTDEENSWTFQNRIWQLCMLLDIAWRSCIQCSVKWSPSWYLTILFSQHYSTWLILVGIFKLHEFTQWKRTHRKHVLAISCILTEQLLCETVCSGGV